MKNVTEVTRLTYNKIAYEYAKNHFNDPEKILLKKFLRFLPQNGKILDVGCGPGRDVKYFIRHGMKATGADFSYSMIKEARKRVPEGEFVRTDMRHLKFKNNTFDGLWSMSSIIHVPKNETKKVLSEFKRVLKPKGILFISVHEGDEEKLDKRDYNKPRFFAAFKLNELNKLVSRSGFKILESKAGSPRKGKAKGMRFVTIFAEVKK